MCRLFIYLFMQLYLRSAQFLPLAVCVCVCVCVCARARARACRGRGRWHSVKEKKLLRMYRNEL